MGGQNEYVLDLGFLVFFFVGGFMRMERLYLVKGIGEP